VPGQGPPLTCFAFSELRLLSLRFLTFRVELFPGFPAILLSFLRSLIDCLTGHKSILLAKAARAAEVSHFPMIAALERASGSEDWNRNSTFIVSF